MNFKLQEGQRPFFDNIIYVHRGEKEKENLFSKNQFQYPKYVRNIF